MSFINTQLVDGKNLFAQDLNINFGNLLILNVYNEDSTALTDASKISFLTAFKFKPGTLRVYLDGLRIRKDAGTPNFVEDLDTDNNGKGFTMSTPPAAGAELIVDYQRANV